MDTQTLGHILPPLRALCAAAPVPELGDVLAHWEGLSAGARSD